MFETICTPVILLLQFGWPGIRRQHARKGEEIK